MLRSVIDDYLTSTKEIQFFIPFMQLLELCGYYDIHLTHSPTEFGKDFIAKKNESVGIVQYSFQIKVGDINLYRFRNEVKPQLIEALTNKLSHPNFDRTLPYRVIFVTSGVINSPTTIEFQEFNRYVEEKLKEIPIVTWERSKLITDFLNLGIEPFFDLHRSPEFAGRFFKFYSQITNDELLSCFEIEVYSKYWLTLDWQNTINKLQVFFEAYFFSKLLLDKVRHYEANLIIASLVRVLLKNGVYLEYKEIIQEYLEEILVKHYERATGVYKKTQPYLLDYEGIFSIFYHPLSCLRTLELLSLYILISTKQKNDLETFFINMLNEQKGCYRVISDNYSVTIVFVALALQKLSKTEVLKKFLNNVTVWLCDRQKEVGISSIGSTLQEEIEQLMSEHLEGFTNHGKGGSFAASACLDIAYLLRDKQFFEDLANEFRASEIVLEFYHVLNDDALFTYDHETIVTSMDPEFALVYEENYSKMINYEGRANSISIKDKSILMLMFLLRDRYFPTFIVDTINRV